MARSENAQLAVDLYNELLQQYQWNADTAWHGIALLLLSCKVWKAGRWQPFREVVVHREANDYKVGRSGKPNLYLRRAENLTGYLAGELGVPPAELCARIGLYWGQPKVRKLQPHNLVGHAFRSLVVTALEQFGAPGLTYAEEVSPYTLFPGHQFHTRSEDPRVDVVASKGPQTVALISTRWRFRHDRVDVVDEALAYVSAARRHNPNCKIYAVVGEFAPNRLHKILSNCPPQDPHGAIDAAVHFAPQMLTDGLQENGRVTNLRSLSWLIGQTHLW